MKKIPSLQERGGRVLIAPSLLSADFGALNEGIALVEAEADFMTVDVMDGHFVPNITVGMPVVRALKTRLPLEVHLMIEQPWRYIPEFIQAGASMVSVHLETIQGRELQVFDMVKSEGAKLSLAIKPATPVEALVPYLQEIDVALVMSVEPGFGGQAFMPQALDKIRFLRGLAPHMDIMVDGGINLETAPLARQAGASILVAGSAVYGAPAPLEAIRLLRG